MPRPRDVLSSGELGTRLRGCRRLRTSRAPLQNSLKLQKAAARLAGGAALHDALNGAGYTASQSSALHFSGAASDSQIAGTLTANYCRTLTDPSLREIGAERRGRDVWMVLAAPVSLPTAADAVPSADASWTLVNAARAAGRRCGAKYFAPAAPLGARRGPDPRGSRAFARHGKVRRVRSPRT